eukprot:Tamp_28451.p1 GENE.Tamp_28451~~Tamp_28451.p1  ORF type:complete len:190 (+),score=20.32 Tamp_28451:174-743(+)
MGAPAPAALGPKVALCGTENARGGASGRRERRLPLRYPAQDSTPAQDGCRSPVEAAAAEGSASAIKEPAAELETAEWDASCSSCNHTHQSARMRVLVLNHVLPRPIIVFSSKVCPCVCVVLVMCVCVCVCVCVRVCVYAGWQGNDSRKSACVCACINACTCVRARVRRTCVCTCATHTCVHVLHTHMRV